LKVFDRASGKRTFLAIWRHHAASQTSSKTIKRSTP
jgi:hypothetical protein